MTHAVASPRHPVPDSRPQRIAFFGHDVHDTTVMKRIGAFERHGTAVDAYLFRRERDAPPRVRDLDWIDLGPTRDRDYAGRIASLARALPVLARARTRIGDADAFYARNLDMLLLADAARRMSGSRAPLIYEALDVRPIMLGSGAASRVFRFAEQRLLGACDLLVVSSPGYIDHYFKAVQRYTGPWLLLENKIDAAAMTAPADRPAADPPPPGKPWVVGWFGVLKCRRSFDLLTRLADVLGDRVEVHIRGITSETDLAKADIEAAARRLPNLRFFGPYANPRDLPSVYGATHITWTGDFLDAAANSAWCLPNRLYEGAAHGSVLLANRGTATAAKIEADKLGWTIPEPLEHTLPAFLEALTIAAFEAQQAAVRAAPRSLFYDLDDTRALLACIGRLSTPRRVQKETEAPIQPLSARSRP